MSSDAWLEPWAWTGRAKGSGRNVNQECAAVGDKQLPREIKAVLHSAEARTRRSNGSVWSWCGQEEANLRGHRKRLVLCKCWLCYFHTHTGASTVVEVKAHWRECGFCFKRARVCTRLSVTMERSYTTVSINPGRLRGSLEDNIDDGSQYYAFKGIPYARPPVKELRFRVRDCDINFFLNAAVDSFSRQKKNISYQAKKSLCSYPP